VQHQLLSKKRVIGDAWGGGLFVCTKQITNQLEDCKVLDFFATFCSNGKKQKDQLLK